VGLPGPVAALHLMGMVPPGWAIAADGSGNLIMKARGAA